jgi:hypothetical protein
VNQDGLKLNGTHQLLVYADDVTILGGSIHTIKKNADTLVVASKESGMEVYADKIKHVVMFRDQNAGQSHSIKINTCSFKNMEELIYLGTKLTNQRCLLSFCAESFVFQFDIQKLFQFDIQKLKD